MSRLSFISLPFPPGQYDHNYFNQVVRALNLYFKQNTNPGPVVATTIQLTQLPTSATGLPVGSVWHDTTDNTLKIVPNNVYQVNVIGQSITASAGTVMV
jgi:hypothetical protein